MALSTAKRPITPPKQKRGPARSTFNSILTLARWQLRATWRLLVVVCVGLLLAVVLACAIPLYVQGSLSAGLNRTVAQDPQNRYISVFAHSPLFKSDNLQAASSSITSSLQNDLGPSIAHSPAFSIHIPPLNMGNQAYMEVIGANVVQATPHLTLLQGRLPATSSGDTIEFVTTTPAVRDLNLQLGKPFTFPYQLIDPFAPDPISARGPQVPMHFLLVGVVAPLNSNDPFWHGTSLAPFPPANFDAEVLPILASNEQMTSVLDQLTTTAQTLNDHYQLSPAPDLYWYYDLDFSHLDINQLPERIDGLRRALTHLNNQSYQMRSYVNGLIALGPLNVLQSYADRVTVAQLPVSSLGYIIAGLLLFFVLIMSDVLVERQVEAIAVLRSRGASAFQVFGALLSQALGQGAIAFLAGPLLAILGVVGLMSMTLAASGRESLDLITSNPIQVAREQLTRDLIVVGIALLGIIFAIWRALWSNVLVLRREGARSTRRPFWIRLKLDALFAAVALVGFGFAQYIQSPEVLNIDAQVRILPVTTLVGAFFLLLASLLVFLRFFPLLLRLIERVAVRNRRAAPMLALAQIARAPRHAQRLALLFALVTAFVLFASTFTQAENQRVVDSVTYQVGSDFSGGISRGLVGQPLDQQMAYYRGIKGVTSVTLGNSAILQGGLDLEAADASTYAQTMYWTAQYGSQPLVSLTSKLVAGRATVAKTHAVPAIIDNAAAQALNISLGQSFAFGNFANGGGHLVVVGIVQYLPTVYDTTTSTLTDVAIPVGAALVDFQSYNIVLQAVGQNMLSVTNVWVRANSQPAALAHVRSALMTGDNILTDGEDRSALIQSLSADSLYATIVGILALGTIVALLLGLIGNLLVTWWNARSRRTSFAVLRALGCPPGQIASVLLWEQGIIYSVGLLLGLLLNIIFSLLILPLLVFSLPIAGSSGSRSLEAFYVTQSVPAVQVPLISWSTLGVLAGLVVFCLLALILMVRVVIGPQIGQSLRIDED